MIHRFAAPFQQHAQPAVAKPRLLSRQFRKPRTQFRVAILSGLVDGFTKEAPVIQVDNSLSAPRVTRALDEVIAERGKPEGIRVDNGPEFTSRCFVAWAEQRGITLIHIQPGKPVQNSFIESFNGRFRDECFNANWFMSMADARRKIEDWRIDYNQHPSQ